MQDLPQIYQASQIVQILEVCVKESLASLLDHLQRLTLQGSLGVDDHRTTLGMVTYQNAALLIALVDMGPEVTNVLAASGSLWIVLSLFGIMKGTPQGQRQATGLRDHPCETVDLRCGSQIDLLEEDQMKIVPQQTVPWLRRGLRLRLAVAL